MDSKMAAPASKPGVILVPGGVMPAELAYGPLIKFLINSVQAIPKDLDVYKEAKPPANYSLDMEVNGIKHIADSRGFAQFHLVGYSAGGAASLAFAANYPKRLLSLALVEPAWAGNEGWTKEDDGDWAAMDHVMSLPPDQRMDAFAHWQMRPGVEPPRLPVPPGPPPPWMAQRPDGLLAISGAFKKYALNRENWRRFRGPVYFALGSLSTRFYERMAKMLAGYFNNFRVEEYEGRSHFDPPHRAEAERFSDALRQLWRIHAGMPEKMEMDQP